MSTEFNWTEELIQEYAEFYRFSSSRTTLEQFKASKQPKPEWEIVALRNNGEVYIEYQGRFVTPSHTVALEWALNNGFEIYSVKRLLDGEVVSIDDIDACDVKVIAFGIYYDKMHVITNKESCYKSMHLMQFEKAKQVLFTTKDGVPLHKGDNYWHVSAEFEVTEQVANAQWLSPVRCFSTKEKAEEYIRDHKKSFSLNDLKEVVGTRDLIGTTFLFDQLAELNKPSTTSK